MEQVKTKERRPPRPQEEYNLTPRRVRSAVHVRTLQSQHLPVFRMFWLFSLPPNHSSPPAPQRNASAYLLRNIPLYKNVKKTSRAITVQTRNVIKIGRPGYKVTKARDLTSNQRSLLFEVDYPEAEDGAQPRHRFMSAYEQKVEAPDKGYQVRG